MTALFLLGRTVEMGTQDGSTILRTILAVGLIGLGLVAAVMEVRADLAPFETRAAYRLQFDTRWRAHVGTIEQALARHDVSAAVRAWHDAYGAALASRGWEGMIAVGDAFLRIGTEAGTVNGSRTQPRQASLAALIPGHPDVIEDGPRPSAAGVVTFFFCVDRLCAQPDARNFRPVLRVSSLHTFRVATNLPTADLIIAGLPACAGAPVAARLTTP